MKHGLGQLSEVLVCPSVNVDRVLELRWNSKLTKKTTNPYPLAPTDLVEAGLVDSRNYRLQNNHLASERARLMTEELERWGSEPGFKQLRGSVFEICGAGLFRGFEFISGLQELDLRVVVLDNSKIACSNATRFCNKRKIRNCEIVHGELIACWDAELIDQLSTVAFYFAQFIQVQSPEIKDAIMFRIGQWLRSTTGEGLPPRRAYLVHARKVDNNRPVSWGGVNLPQVVWGESLPYEDDELLVPAQAGFGSSAELELTVLGQHSYYHQVYSLMRLMPSKTKTI